MAQAAHNFKTKLSNKMLALANGVAIGIGSKLVGVKFDSLQLQILQVRVS